MTTKETPQNNNHTACWLTILGLLALVIVYSLLAYFAERSSQNQRLASKERSQEPTRPMQDGHGNHDAKKRKSSAEVNEPT